MDGVGDGLDNVQPPVGTPPPSPDKVQPSAGMLDNTQLPVVGNPDKTADDNMGPLSPDAGNNDRETDETDGDGSPVEGASDGIDSDATPQQAYIPVNPIP